jgi:uncharacterized protein DUF6542
VSTGAPHRRTLWQEGRRPGPLVAVAAGLLVLAVVVLDLLVFSDLTLLFDTAFVLVCTAAALAVRPRDFFVIGVFPPLLMAVTIGALAQLSRGSVADPGDGFLQTLVSGLAHHAGALVTGYALTLVVLALRQVALRHSGTIRFGRRSRVSDGRSGRRTGARPDGHPAREPQPRPAPPPERRPEARSYR